MTAVKPTKQPQFSNNSDLDNLSRQLNAESDALQDTLQEINTKFASLNIGLEVWPQKSELEEVFLIGQVESETAKVMNRFTEGENSQYGTGWVLGYAKVDSAWTICARPVLVHQVSARSAEVVIDEMTFDGNPVAILKAPRALRIAAAERLPKLIEKIKAHVTRSLDAIHKAREIAKTL